VRIGSETEPAGETAEGFHEFGLDLGVFYLKGTEPLDASTRREPGSGHVHAGEPQGRRKITLPLWFVERLFCPLPLDGLSPPTRPVRTSAGVQQHEQ